MPMSTPGFGTQEIECERHGIADEWPEQVAVEEYARLFADFPVGGDRWRDEPVDEVVQPGQGLALRHVFVAFAELAILTADRACRMLRNR